MKKYGRKAKKLTNMKKIINVKAENYSVINSNHKKMLNSTL